MMVDVKALREAIRISPFSIAALSAEIGMDDSTFYRKLNTDGSTFTLAQVDAMTKALKLDAEKAQAIFFSY